MKVFSTLLAAFFLNVSSSFAQGPELLDENLLITGGPISEFSLLFIELFIGPDAFLTVGQLNAQNELYNLSNLDQEPVSAEIEKTVSNCEEVSQFELYEECGRVYAQTAGSFIHHNTFTKFENDQLIELGYTTNSTGEDQAYICTQNKLIYSFPLSYGDSYTCDYQYEPDELLVGFQDLEEGSCTSQVDSWGTLELPGGTLNNELKLKVIEEGTISTYFDGSLLITNSFLRTSYKFLCSGYAYPVATLTEYQYGNNNPTYSAEYLDDDYILAIDNPSAEEFGWEVFPNPVIGDQFQVNYKVPQPEIANVNLFTIDGRKVFSENRVLLDKEGVLDFGIPEVQSGLYLLIAESEGFTRSVKIQVL
jgi:hypothetical protein